MVDVLRISATYLTTNIHYSRHDASRPVVSKNWVSIRQLDLMIPKKLKRRTSLIISNTVDLSSDKDLAKLEEKGVKGRYVSIERIRELENGKVEWRMAVSSNTGGMIPSFISEGSMDREISKVIVIRIYR